jgi:hypothetical protein
LLPKLLPLSSFEATMGFERFGATTLAKWHGQEGFIENEQPI